MTVELTSADIAGPITAFLEDRTKVDVPPDQDLFASGLVSSIFAMELIVHVEQTFDVAITGSDLRLDNFRTVDRMTGLVTRLRAGA